VSEFYTLTGANWILQMPTPITDIDTLTPTGWVTVSNSGGGTIVSDGQGGVTATPFTGGIFRRSTRVVVLGGKRASDIPGLPISNVNVTTVDVAVGISVSTSVITAGLPASANVMNMVFPTGAELYWEQFSQMDGYTLSTSMGSQVQSPTCAAGSTCNLTTLAELVSNYPTSLPNATGTIQQTTATIAKNFASNRMYSITFDAGGTSTGGAVTVWRSMAPRLDGANYSISMGQSTYEIKTVYGQQVLLIKPLDNLSSNRILLFSIKDGLVFNGYLSVASTDFSPALAYFNKVAINAIFTADGKPVVVN